MLETMPPTPSQASVLSLLRSATQQRLQRCCFAFSPSPSHLFTSYGFTSTTPKCRQRPLKNSVSVSASSSNGSSPSPHGRLWLPNGLATHRLGSLFGQDARPSDVLLLSGSLGAGKTCFARGYIQTARRDTTLDVTSPTYLLVNSYPPERGEDCPTVYHMDLWRLDDGTKRAIVDFEEVFGKHISLIEWPDRLKGRVPPERLEVLLEYPEREAKVNKDDPWGFGSGDLGDMGAARDGRFATLLPFGDKWEGRVKRIHDELTVLDEIGRLVIADR